MASKTTELDAVNIILSAVGEPPITSLDSGTLPADAAMAKTILTEASREIQSMGWHFNTVRDVVLIPDSADADRIAPGDNALRVDLEAQHTGSYDIVHRGDYLYDRKGQTYAFTGASLKALVVYMLEWTELPEPARRLIATRGARIFQSRMVGSGDHHSFTMQDEFNAMALLREFEGETANHSIFGHYDVYRTIDRGSVANRITR
tara:strand:+ start:1542 stop:2156 length:615 start_codon:yes stop_codon:yes gene_type:complete